jgi:hypothetical protein
MLRTSPLAPLLHEKNLGSCHFVKAESLIAIAQGKALHDKKDNYKPCRGGSYRPYRACRMFLVELVGRCPTLLLMPFQGSCLIK